MVKKDPKDPHSGAASDYSARIPTEVRPTAGKPGPHYGC